MYPEDLKYTKDHEWISVSNQQGRIGITDHAQKQLGEIVFVDLPDIGKTVKQGETLCVIDSVKASSDIYAPVSGEVVEVNAALKQNPEAINHEPHATWIAVVKLADPGELATLMDATQYAELVK
jgi:glycine cleavage system H protein